MTYTAAEKRDYRKRPEVKAKEKLAQQRVRETRTDLLKQGKACILCGEDFPDCLDFHHRDPATKTGTISHIARFRPMTELLAEVAKCDLLCANCHRKTHAIERDLNVAFIGT